MSSESSLKSEFSWILLGNLFYAAMQYLMLISMVKLTTPALVGQFSLGLAINAPIALFMSMAIRAVVISDSQNRFSRNTYLKLRSLTAVCTFLVGVIFVIFSKKTGVVAEVILLIALVKAFESISDITYGFMQKFGQTHQIAKSLIFRGVLSFVLADVFLYETANIVWLCVGWLIATVIVLFAYDIPRLPASRPSPQTADEMSAPQNMSSLFILAFPLGIATVLSSLESNAPRYFVEGGLGLSALGIFSALSYPLMLTNQVVGSLASAPAPRLAHLFHQREYAKFKDLLKRLVLIAFGLSFLSSAICALLGKTILTILNGPAYALEKDTFVILSIATGCSAVAIFFGAALSAMQCFQTKLILQILSLATVITAAAIAANQKSLLAMGFALLAGAIVSLVAQIVAFRLEYKRRTLRPPPKAERINQLKVLHIFGKMDRGGAEMRTLDMLRELQTNSENRIQFDFCVLSGQCGELDDAIRNLRGRIFYLPLRIGFSQGFKRLLREQEYDSIHSHVHLFSGYLLKLAHQIGVPSRICHLHTTGGYGENQIRKRLQNWFMKKWLWRHGTAFVAVSKGVENIFLRQTRAFANDSRLKVVYDGIDPKNFICGKMPSSLRQDLNVSVDQKVVVHVGRLDPVKNHRRLLRIFATLIRANPQVRLVMVGKTEPQALKDLNELAQTLGILEKIHFTGARDDVYELLSSADLMIFPSLWEGLPGAVLEAAALGLPVLSTDLPGSLELAEYFDSIRVLSLSQSDDEWAAMALSLLALPATLRSSQLDVLRQSPFNVENALKKMMPLWQQIN